MNGLRKCGIYSTFSHKEAYSTIRKKEITSFADLQVWRASC
jgi:hypothetical protein